MKASELAMLESEIGLLQDYIDALPEGTQKVYIASQAKLIAEMVADEVNVRIRAHMDRKTGRTRR